MAIGFPVVPLTQDGFPVYLVDTIKHIRYRGKKVGFLGDSITNNASAGAGRDWTRQLKRILGSAVISDVDFVQAGFPGNNSTQILTFFDEYIKDNNVEVLFAMMGVNNIIQDLPIEIFIASIKELHRKCVDANIPLILGTITPIRGTEYTVARKEAIAKHNMFLRLYCSQNNIRLADTFTPLAVVSGASAGQANSIYYNVDGIHPNTYGHLYIAKAFADAFNGLFTAPHLVDSINSFNLVANPTLVADAIGWQEQAG
jgi:lysophospholipase L1-like esterase